MMCTLFEEIAKEGEIKGKAEGIIRMLKKYNETEKHILEELMLELDIPLNTAEEYLEKYNDSIL